MTYRNIKSNDRSGFTLIEVVVYLALFGILFTGAVTGAYSILESTGRNYTRAVMQEEGEFLLAKINWAVSNASTAQVPEGGVLMATVAGIDLEFKLSGTDLVLSRDAAAALPLNGSEVTINSDSLYFVDITAAGSPGIKYGFDLAGKTSEGYEMVSSFESTAYLRK